MTSENVAGNSRRRIDLPASARTLAADLVRALTAVINELNENPQSAGDAKSRHDLILKNVRSLSQLVAVEEKLEKRLQTSSDSNSMSELKLAQARTEIANRIARLAAAGEG